MVVDSYLNSGRQGAPLKSIKGSHNITKGFARSSSDHILLLIHISGTIKSDGGIFIFIIILRRYFRYFLAIK